MKYLIFLIIFQNCYADTPKILNSHRRIGEVTLYYESRTLNDGHRIVTCSVEGGDRSLSRDLLLKRWEMYAYFRKDMETRNCGGNCIYYGRDERSTTMSYDVSNRHGISNGDCQVGTEAGFYWFTTKDNKIAVVYADIDIPVQTIRMNY